MQIVELIKMTLGAKNGILIGGRVGRYWLIVGLSKANEDRLDISASVRYVR